MTTLTLEAKQQALSALLDVTHSIQLLDENAVVLATFPIRGLMSQVAAYQSEIRAHKGTIECLQKLLRELKDKLERTNESWGRGQDYWFMEARKAEAERDALKVELGRAKQIIEGLSKST